MVTAANTYCLAFLTVITFGTATTPIAKAQSLITNGSFEDIGGVFVNNGQGYMALPTSSATIPGWTITGDQTTWLLSGDQSFGSTPFGSFFLDLTGTHDNGSFAGVTQTISTVPSQTYTLSFSIGVNQDDPVQNGSKSVSVTAGVSNTSFIFVPSGTGMQWGNFSFDFIATSFSTPISIAGTSSGTGIQALYLDNVSVVPVPVVSIRPSAWKLNPTTVSEVEIYWSFRTNKTYEVLFRSDLTTNQWTNLGAPIPGTSGTNWVTDKLVVGQPQRFYRVVETR